MRVHAYDLTEKRGSICQWICAHMRAGGSSEGPVGCLLSHVACGCGPAQRQSAHLALVGTQHEQRLQRIAEGGFLRGSEHARQQREDTLLVDEAAEKVDRLTHAVGAIDIGPFAHRDVASAPCAAQAAIAVDERLPGRILNARLHLVLRILR